MTGEPMVSVYRLDWTGDTLPIQEAVAFTGEIVFYARKHADQAWAQVQAWLTQVPGSDVLVSTEEIPLDEWIGDYSGCAEDAEVLGS